MSEKIFKRDGREVDFIPSKITAVIKKAFAVTGESAEPELEAQELTLSVLRRIKEEKLAVPTVEQIQDLVEKSLMTAGRYETAKAYILYRHERTKIRERKSDLMETVAELSQETSRENANVGGSASAKNFQIGCAASEKYNLLSVIPDKFAQAHINGDIHIHDLPWYNLSINCLQIPLGELLEKGFRTQNGWVRPPKRISSAGALAAIIMQISQNDMFGGQSFSAFDRDMAPYADQVSEEEIFQAMESFIYNLNMMHSRAGGQVVFSSINLGTDTSTGGRKIITAFLEAYEAGLGKGEPAIFPNVIFKVKKGVNFNPGDPNYDLFKLACRVSSKRLNPTFSFMDATFNAPYGDQVAYMGCRTRVMANRRGPEVTDKRGNLAFATVNLPRIALKAQGSPKVFWKELNDVTELAIDQLKHRYDFIAKLKVKDLPFVMGEHLYLGSENLQSCDPIENAVQHGTLSVGFIGLVECLYAFGGKHHGQDNEMLEFAEEIISFMRNKVDEACEQYDLNYALLATPAEGLCGRFVKLDRKKYGLIPDVTDKEFYTNSYHLPVDFKTTIADKIEIEGRFHKYCNGGHITYVELASPPEHNPEAVETIIRCMADNNVGYGGINYPLDTCADCGYTGIIADECPGCGNTNIKRIRRVTGYLGTTDRFNDAKLAELSRRVPIG